MKLRRLLDDERARQGIVDNRAGPAVGFPGLGVERGLDQSDGETISHEEIKAKFLK